MIELKWFIWIKGFKKHLANIKTESLKGLNAEVIMVLHFRGILEHIKAEKLVKQAHSQDYVAEKDKLMIDSYK